MKDKLEILFKKQEIDIKDKFMAGKAMFIQEYNSMKE